MYSFTETVLVAASHQRVWEVMGDIEGWWPDSNPDHESFVLLDPGPVTRVGARLRIVQKSPGCGPWPRAWSPRSTPCPR